MNTFLEYLLYALGFTAAMLAVEGVGYLLRGLFGDERLVRRRLNRTRARMTSRSEASTWDEDLSARLLARLPRLKAALAQADAGFSALQLMLGAAALFVAVVLLLPMAGAPPLAGFVAGAVLAVGGPYLLLAVMANRRRRRFLEQLPQAVDLIARSLQAGHPVATAMATVGQRMPAPLGPEFRLVIEEMTYGLDRDEALGNLLQRFPAPELRMFVASMEVTRESGGNLAEVFLKLAESIRAKDHLRRKVHAITAEGRMSFWVVTGLPFLVAGALLVLRPAFFSDVRDDPMFWPMMTFAPVTLAIGATIIWRMVNLKI